MNILVGAKHGQFIVPANDFTVGSSLVAYGEWEEPQVQTCLRYLEPGDTVLDIGAHLGTFTVPFARKVGPKGRVFALEPQRYLFQLLCGNIALNNMQDSVLPMQVALGREAGSIEVPHYDFNADINSGGLNLRKPIPAEASHETVPMLALDSIGQKAALLKLDIEGMELEVLRGGVNYLQAHRPVCLVEANEESQAADLVEFFSELNYSAHICEEYLFQPANFFGNSRNIFPDIESRNLLFVPRGKTYGS